MTDKSWEDKYQNLKEGYAALQGEYERLIASFKELEDENKVAERRILLLQEQNEELAVAYNNAQKEISVLKKGGNRE